jgi:hypothetical protein
MNNAFHEIEQMLQNESITVQDSIRALLAILHLECCEHCCARIRSEEFLLAVHHLAKELELCRRLRITNAA